MNLSVIFIEIAALLASFTVLVFGMLLISPLTFISDYPPRKFRRNTIAPSTGKRRKKS